PRHLSPLLALLTCVAPGCGQPAIPPEEKPPPATVKWEGPLQSNLEEWTQLVGTTMPLPDRVARITAPIEGRVTWLPTSGQDTSVGEGTQVPAGAVLRKLDSTVSEATLAKLKAAQEVPKEEQKQAQYAMDLAVYEVDRLQKLKKEEARRSRETGMRISLVS